jgi:predicted oxidoreductase
VGAGIAGLSAAIESARLGRDVVLVDSLPLIGGQMVHSLVGLFCGVFGNAPRQKVPDWRSGRARNHPPLKRGWRLSAKALRPSSKSPEAAISCWIWASSSSCSSIRW